MGSGHYLHMGRMICRETHTSSRKALSSTLLDESYRSVNQQVFRASPQLSIVADESTNITGDRIENDTGLATPRILESWAAGEV